MGRKTLQNLLIGLVVGALVAVATPDRRDATPRDLVAALPGVGYGWLDTLERVTGAAAIDTISGLERFDVCCDMLGLFERWHALVSVDVHMIDYGRYAKAVQRAMRDDPWSYYHPVDLSYPAGIVAHEYGHLFQFKAWPHVPPVTGDTLPSWASDDNAERYADRFSRAMLALRGWADPDTADDKVLNHRVRYLLLKSYWRK